MDDYELRINALIPKAERLAHEYVESMKPQTTRQHSQMWDRAFHDAMHRLAAQKGLRFIGDCAPPSKRAS